jgi:hypothetical protein
MQRRMEESGIGSTDMQSLVPRVHPAVCNDVRSGGTAGDVASRLDQALEARGRIDCVTVAPHKTIAVIEEQRVSLVEAAP